MTAHNSLIQGNEYPYDASDDWWDGKHDAIYKEDDWAYRAARGVIADLADRRDIKRGFENVNEGIRAEIVATLAEIIREAHDGRSRI